MSQSQQPPTIKIVENGDLTFKLVKAEKVTDVSGNITFRVVRELAYFEVTKQILVERSEYFKSMLAGAFMEANQNVVQIENETIASLELWLRHFHGTLIEQSYKLPIEEIYYAIQLSIKRGFHTEDLNDWFGEYWNRVDKDALGVHNFAKLMYPCRIFDHPEAFMFVTRGLTMNGTGHLREENPTRYIDLHCEKGVINGLRAAKGSMRKVINQAIHKQQQEFLRANCECKEKALFAFVKSLDDTGAWPFDDQTKSIEGVLAGFERFEYTPPKNACGVCSGDIKSEVINLAIWRTQTYFNGLCLDCMDQSKSKTGSKSADYWLHARLEDWSRGCRIHHPRNTWYHSFMGSPDEKQAYEREMQDRKTKKRKNGVVDNRSFKQPAFKRLRPSGHSKSIKLTMDKAVKEKTVAESALNDAEETGSAEQVGEQDAAEVAVAETSLEVEEDTVDSEEPEG